MRLHTCSHLRGLGSRKRAESRVGLVNPRNLLLELKIPSKSSKIVGPSNRTHEAVGHFLSKPKWRLEGEGNWLCCIIEVAECKFENPEILVLMVALLGGSADFKTASFLFQCAWTKVFGFKNVGNKILHPTCKDPNEFHLYARVITRWTDDWGEEGQ